MDFPYAVFKAGKQLSMCRPNTSITCFFFGGGHSPHHLEIEPTNVRRDLSSFSICTSLRSTSRASRFTASISCSASFFPNRNNNDDGAPAKEKNVTKSGYNATIYKTYILNEDTHAVTHAIGVQYHTQLAKRSFYEIFHLAAGVYVYFFMIYKWDYTRCNSRVLCKGCAVRRRRLNNKKSGTNERNNPLAPTRLSKAK